MLEALLRATCLAAVVLLLAELPGLVLTLLVLLLLASAVLSNRTHRSSIANRTVLITGASSGLGKAIALDAARRRATHVFLLARSADKLEQTAAEIRAHNPWCTPHVLPCDMGDPDQVRAVAEGILEEHGAPDLLVNNAGAGAWQHIEEGTAADAQAHMAVPYLGAVWLTQAFAPAMIARGSGHVLNVTSGAALAGFRAAITYGSARWAMRGFSQYLRADLAERGIGVTLLNAAEITGTAYFDDAPGKAGSASQKRIPWLFHLEIIKTFMGDTHAVAASALNGVEQGTHEVLYPQVLMVPIKLFGDLFPEALHHSLRLGDNGRR